MTLGQVNKIKNSQILKRLARSRSAESRWGCSDSGSDSGVLIDSDSGSDSGVLIDSDSGSGSGVLIDSDSGSDSDSGFDAKYEINNT